MSSLAEKFSTYDDLLDVPEHMVAEILNGYLETHPRPAPKHANALSTLGFEVGSPFHRGKGGPGGWWILDEPELHLGSDVMVPDLAGWKRDRMPELPDTAWFEQEPDWACEILSPSTARIDRVVKMPLYARYGVKHIWLIDPILKTLEAFELQENNWVLLDAISEDDTVSLPPFDAIDFPLSALWT